jgi:hypothetical protein
VDNQLQPFQDQWEFLSSIQRISVKHLERIYHALYPAGNTIPRTTHSEKLQFFLDNEIRLNRSGITHELINYLKEELNFANSEYFIRKQTGKNTWGTDRYFRFIEEKENEVIIPRGFIGKLIRYCNQQKIGFEFRDERKKHAHIHFKTEVNLMPHQESVMEIAGRKDFGVIAAPPGSGKTVIG